MRYIKPEIVKQIFDTVNIIDIVSDYVTLKKKGANYWALSPFTSEHTPSFSVSPTKNIFKCFSTGKAGNAITFLMELEGYTYPEALHHVAKRYQIEIPEAEEPQEKSLQIEAVTILLNTVNRLYTSNKTQINNFIRERHITEEIAEKFQIGYAENAWEHTKNYVLGKGYSLEIAEAANIVSKSEKNGNYYDVFRNRIMFPIYSQIGKIVGFGGRVLSKEDSPKYINTRETIVYEKSKILYGLHLAKTAIKKMGYAILTEGYMDVIMMHQHGYENTVASSGTALTPDQARLIRRFTKNVLLVYDGDAAGVKSALKAINILITEGLSVEILILPDNHDPDSYLKKFGKEGFEVELGKKLSFMDFTLKYNVNGNDPAKVKEGIEVIAQTISLIEDKVEAQLYSKQLSDKTGVDYSLIYDIVNKKVVEKKPKIDLSFIDISLQSQSKPTISEIEFTEKMILEILVNYGENYLVSETNETILVSEYIKQRIGMLSFFNSTYQLMRSEYYGGKCDFYIHNDDRVKMAIMSLNTVSTLISTYLKDYDSCDLQMVFFSIVNALTTTYKREWHQKMFTETIKKLSYKDTLEHFNAIIVPLIENANIHNEYQL